MKGFKKLILTSAILAASSSAFAMQALDEETMSATTGQDGLTLTINNSTITDLDVTWVDRGGFAGYLTDGGVTITNVGLTLSNLEITVDAGNDGATASQLSIGFSTINNVVVDLNNTTITVGDASAVDTTTTVMTDTYDIVRFGGTSSIVIGGGLSGSIKLGNRAAGEHLMSLDVTNPFDISLAGGVSVLSNQAGTEGISVGAITIQDLALHTDIDVVAGGLQIDNSGTTIGQVSLEQVAFGTLGTTPAIGDIYLTGMNISSTMTLAGH